jgi:ABC-type Fe3+-hydroxamate transport system substrate-binding protein
MLQKPDVVILPPCSENKAVALLASPGWRSLPAVKNKKVYFKYNQDELYRLGPRLLNGIKFLYKCFYPEKSKDADEAQVK